ncbi:MAG TPA: HD domain-containing protein [Erysipelotrichaceae bacterium]|nr:HD domain-containing protein [Erysipelotrichaceae bacterium]HQB32089.1 HD domain-containing protein [Erysipelotrichaceae bacterium]
MIYQQVIENEEINAYISKANEVMKAAGYTDHSKIHTAYVAARAGYILRHFGCSPQEIDLAKTAAYMHDIGNSIARRHHAEYGSLLAKDLLKQIDISPQDTVTVVSAISNHDESTGIIVNNITAALIIADKSDVRRIRVQNGNLDNFDIHDQVNYSVLKNELTINDEDQSINLHLEIDTEITSMYEYLEIFMDRMLMCRKAARTFDCAFHLYVNSAKIL